MSSVPSPAMRERVAEGRVRASHPHNEKWISARRGEAPQNRQRHREEERAAQGSEESSVLPEFEAAVRAQRRQLDVESFEQHPKLAHRQQKPLIRTVPARRTAVP